MVKKNKNDKNQNDRSTKIIKNALEKLQKDWYKLLKKKKLAEDKQFLRKVANDILELEKDVISAETDKNMPIDALHEILENPRKNFFTNTSLVDAALSFKYDDAYHSELYHLLKDFSHYSTEFDDEYVTIFWSLLERLKS